MPLLVFFHQQKRYEKPPSKLAKISHIAQNKVCQLSNLTIFFITC